MHNPELSVVREVSIGSFLVFEAYDCALIEDTRSVKYPHDMAYTT